VVALDWLSARNNNNNNNNNNVIIRDGAHLFVGQAGLLVTAPTVLTDELSVAMRVQLRRGVGGYLFAKTSASGQRRYLGLYASPIRKDVTFYYRTDGRQRRLRFRVDLADGRPHTVLVTVSGQEYITLRVDGIVVGEVPRRLESDTGEGLQDCGAPSNDCILFVGQRADGAGNTGAYHLTGIVRDARFFANASLSHYPPA
jgi:hypothetical protein